jgi:hypothetical protein
MTAPKPKPTPAPEPDPPEPDPDEEPEAEPNPDLNDRVKTLEAFVQDLGERLNKLEERVAAPPVGIGRRP